MLLVVFWCGALTETIMVSTVRCRFRLTICNGGGRTTSDVVVGVDVDGVSQNGIDGIH